MKHLGLDNGALLGAEMGVQTPEDVIAAYDYTTICYGLFKVDPSTGGRKLSKVVKLIDCEFNLTERPVI